jgi:hypothetical protein
MFGFDNHEVLLYKTIDYLMLIKYNLLLYLILHSQSSNI